MKIFKIYYWFYQKIYYKQNNNYKKIKENFPIILKLKNFN